MTFIDDIDSDLGVHIHCALAFAHIRPEEGMNRTFRRTRAR